MDRRDILSLGLALPFLAQPALAETPSLSVAKSPTCGCCGAWITAMREAGFVVQSRDLDQEALWALKQEAGITPELSACHTARIAGYVIEGHVPAADLRRLLAERPAALGLSVPGMPIGSPGMEMGDERETYETLLVLEGGRWEVFARHG